MPQWRSESAITREARPLAIGLCQSAASRRDLELVAQLHADGPAMVSAGVAAAIEGRPIVAGG